MGTLYYGDDLDILQRHVKDESVEGSQDADGGSLAIEQPPTGPMETEAASTGFHEQKTNQQKFPRLQLRTVKELMDGKSIERPSSAAAIEETFKKAPKSKKRTATRQNSKCSQWPCRIRLNPTKPKQTHERFL